MDKEKVQILADRLQNLFTLIDGFMNSLEDEDFNYLEEAKEQLKNKISYGNSAIPVIMALGGNYDDMEDRMKLKSLECIVELTKVRKEYKEKLIEKAETDKVKRENLEIFRAMGLF